MNYENGVRLKTTPMTTKNRTKIVLNDRSILTLVNLVEYFVVNSLEMYGSECRNSVQALVMAIVVVMVVVVVVMVLGLMVVVVVVDVVAEEKKDDDDDDEKNNKEEEEDKAKVLTRIKQMTS